MKPESADYRKRLAEDLKSAPKKERGAMLDQAKKTPDYWQARGEKISEVQGEEPIDEGLGVFVKKKTLYHGSSVKGIEKLDVAEEDTVGSGIYFTSEPKDAIGYARRRAKNRNGSPIIYEASVENLKLLDLRKEENVKKILPGYAKKLRDMLKDADWNVAGVLENALDAIAAGSVGPGNVREIAQIGRVFSEYVESLGYAGLVTLEGGEGEEIGEHDSYVIFDPKDARIDQQSDII